MHAERYRPEIDGLRAVAVLMVIVFHAFPRLLPGGFLGVDVFFVISGYLISSIIFREHLAGDFSLARFYARRIRQIFPALITVIAVTMVVGSLILLSSEFRDLGAQAAAAAAFVSNIYFEFIVNYFAPAAASRPLIHLWSLGVEEQFYIVWPLVVPLLLRSKRWVLGTIALLTVASFAACFLPVFDDGTKFYLPMFRAWELLLGCGLAWREVEGREGPHAWTAEVTLGAGLVLILGSGVLLKSALPGWPALGATVGAGLVIWSGRASALARVLLSNRLAVFIGLISYPLYLWHWPALWLLQLLSPDPDTSLVVAACLVAFLLAWPTMIFIERPIRRAPGRKLAIPLLAGMAALALVPATGSLDAYRWQWNPALVAIDDLDIQNLYRRGTCLLLPAQAPTDFASECYPPPAPGKKTILLWGDSGAAALYPGLLSLGDESVQIGQLTMASCAPFIDPAFRENTKCPAVNSHVLQRIAEQPPDAVILSFATTGYRLATLEAYVRETVASLKSLGVGHIVLVGPPPQWRTFVPRLLANQLLFTQKMPQRLFMTEGSASRSMGYDQRLRDTANDLGIQYTSALEMFCDASSCQAFVDGAPLQWDNFHLTVGASRRVALRIEELLAEVPPSPDSRSQ